MQTVQVHVIRQYFNYMLLKLTYKQLFALSYMAKFNFKQKQVPDSL